MSAGREPLVSLIMPVRDPHPGWLREAVDAALAQVGCAVELIVVDDGCPEPVSELLAGVDDERLRILRLPQGGVSRARNAGLAASSGSYVRFLDCDDVVVPDSTAHLVALADGRQDLVVYGATLVCDEELRPLSTISSRLAGRVAEACLLNRFDTTIHSLLFPRSVVDRVGLWEPSILVSQDWDFALRAFEIADVSGDRRVATFYRNHPRMNSRNVEAGIRGYELVVRRYFERNPGREGTRLHGRAWALFHLFAAVQLATRTRRRRAALAHLRKAFALDPLRTALALPRHAATLLPPAARPRRGAKGRWRGRG